MRLAVTVWPWVLAAVILAPLMAPGYILSYDMVFVPDLAMRPDFLGFGTGLPRAVPSDAVVALLDEVVPGMLLQKLVLVGALVLAGVGARRLVPADSGVAQLAATSLYVWNPYVAERLGIGHWPTLLAYAALPWVLAAALRFAGGGRALPELTLWLALAALSASGGGMALLVAVLGVLRPTSEGVRRVAVVLGVGLGLNAPWILAGLLHEGGGLTDPGGAAAFATRGEGFLSAPLAALGLGGIWNQEVVPVTRSGWAAVVMLAVVTVVAALGVRAWVQRLPRQYRFALLVAGLAGFTIAVAGVWAPHAVEWWVSTVPGGGLIRDGGRFLALLAPLQASLFGMGVDALAGLLRARLRRIAVAAGAVFAPLALMPDLAWGLAGQLTPVPFPEEYAVVRDRLVAEADSTDRLLVLPFASYRAPSWNNGRRVLDPLGRYLPLDYTSSDVLFVSGVPLQGEDPLVVDITSILERGGTSSGVAAALADVGISWVIRDREAESAVGADALSASLPRSMLVQTGPNLDLWAVPGATEPASDPLRSVLLVTSWAAAAGVAGLASVVLVTRRMSRRRVQSPAK